MDRDAQRLGIGLLRDLKAATAGFVEEAVYSTTDVHTVLQEPLLEPDEVLSGHSQGKSERDTFPWGSPSPQRVAIALSQVLTALQELGIPLQLRQPQTRL